MLLVVVATHRIVLPLIPMHNLLHWCMWHTISTNTAHAYQRKVCPCMPTSNVWQCAGRSPASLSSLFVLPNLRTNLWFPTLSRSSQHPWQTFTCFVARCNLFQQCFCFCCSAYTSPQKLLTPPEADQSNPAMRPSAKRALDSNNLPLQFKDEELLPLSSLNNSPIPSIEELILVTQHVTHCARHADMTCPHCLCNRHNSLIVIYDQMIDKLSFLQFLLMIIPYTNLFYVKILLHQQS